MQCLFCSDDAFLVARWRQSGVTAIESRIGELPRHLLDEQLQACVLDTQGLETTTLHALLQSYPHHRFLIATSRPNPQEAIQFLAEGARGYVNRQLQPEVLAIALQTVANGELWAGAETITYLLHHQTSTAPFNADNLSDREQQVANAVVEGLSNKQIAARLDITERTVKAHLKACFQKTGCANRLQLALQLGNARAEARQVV